MQIMTALLGITSLIVGTSTDNQYLLITSHIWNATSVIIGQINK